MGLMNKLRDMFTEEVEEYEEEEPIKKEVIQVEIPAPQQKEEEEVVEAPKEEKVQPKVNQPIFFDDNDFANLEPPKKVEKPSYKKHSGYDKKKVEEKPEKKVFKPTPIISPVYGVLDKNYHKEDIRQKNNYSSSAYYSNKEVSIDDIRKKAYGTLEDDLEVTLFGEPEKVNVEPEVNMDMFDELLDDTNKTETTVDDSDLFNLIDSMYEKESDNNGSSK